MKAVEVFLMTAMSSFADPSCGEKGEVSFYLRTFLSALAFS